MVKVKECCCGCTLRTGSLILMWLTLVLGCIGTLGYLSMLCNPRNIGFSSLSTLLRIRLSFFAIDCIVGIAVSVLGIYAAQKKNKPEYLNGIFYYFCYQVIYDCLTVVAMIFSPSIYYGFFNFDPVPNSSSRNGIVEYLTVKIITNLFFIAMMCYFALVLRSYRDSMKNNNSNNNNAEIPDPAAIGYQYHVA